MFYYVLVVVLVCNVGGSNKEEIQHVIPKVIHQTWKTSNLSPQMTNNINKIIELNSEYRHKFYNDEDMYRYVEMYCGDKVLKAIHFIKPGAYKADIFRYCLLWNEGGIYLDIKASFTSRFSEFIETDTSFISIKDGYTNYGIHNGFIACVPKEPLMRLALDMSVDMVEKKKYGKTFLDVTGPDLLGRAFNILIGRQEETPVEVESYIVPNKYVIIPWNPNHYHSHYHGYYGGDRKEHYPDLWRRGNIYGEKSSEL